MVKYLESKKKFWVVNCPGKCKTCELFKLKPKWCVNWKAFKKENEKVEIFCMRRF